MKHFGGPSDRRQHTQTIPRRQYAAGFTIIEVLIVLAIAGLILLIVFLVVPTLQKRARDYNRKHAVDFVFSQMEEYRSTHGQYPIYAFRDDADNREEFVANLMNEPRLKNFSIRYETDNLTHEYPFGGDGAPADPADAFEEISIGPGHVCNRDQSVSPGDTDYPIKLSPSGYGDYKNFSVFTQLEGAPIFCVDTVGD